MYQLEARAKGFSDALYETVVVAAARTADLNVELKVGESTETVRVSTQAEVLETRASRSKKETPA
jgi:hypothetical protein